MPRSPKLLTQQTYVVSVHRGGSVCRCKLHGGELSGDARYMGVMVGSCGTRWGRAEHGGGHVGCSLFFLIVTIA